jgi:hypothetical protein
MAGKDRRPEELAPVGLVDLDLPAFMEHHGQSNPTHLAPVVDVITEAAKGKALRVVIAAPRQHGKTTVLLHAVPWILARTPKRRVAYATYGQQFAGTQSRVMRAIARSSGVRLSDDMNTIQQWDTAEGGGLLATSVDGPLTGHSVGIGLVDDVFKGRAEAESMERRDLAWSWLRGDLMGCIGPKGSILMVGSRYVEDDPAGRAIRQLGWDEIRLPAICDDEDADPLHRRLGDPLCPWGPDPNEPRDLAFLLAKRAEVGEFEWSSLYQGRPQPRSGSLFKGTHTYREIPL